MDIQAALFDLLQALYDGDREGYKEQLETLRRWHDNGGYMPQVIKVVTEVNDGAGELVSTTFEVHRQVFYSDR